MLFRSMSQRVSAWSIWQKNNFRCYPWIYNTPNGNLHLDATNKRRQRNKSTSNSSILGMVFLNANRSLSFDSNMRRFPKELRNPHRSGSYFCRQRMRGRSKYQDANGTNTSTCRGDSNIFLLSTSVTLGDSSFICFRDGFAG